MRKVYYEDQTIEMSELEFLYLLKYTADSTHVTAGTLCSAAGGFPDVTGNLVKRHWDEQEYDRLQNLISQIDNEELNELFASQCLQVQNLYDLDDELLKVVANFFSLSPPKTQRDPL